MRLRFAAICLAIVPALSGSVLAANDVMTKGQMKDAATVESVTIPSPGEFFAAIDKLDPKPLWSQLFLAQGVGTTDDRAQMALNLGTLVADGYIAVEAEDSQSVKNIGRDIINLAKKLNVSQSIIGRGNSINDFAENNDWSVLREELEATQNEVKLSMAAQKDEPLIILVTIGAWIRGIDAISGFVVKNYTAEGAKILRQPAILEYLLSQIDTLPPNLAADPLLVEIRKDLDAARVIVDTDPAQPLPLASITSLHDTMSGLVKEINGKGPNK